MTEDREEAQAGEPDSPEELTTGELPGEPPEESTDELVNEYSHLDLEEQILALLKDCTRFRMMLGKARTWPRGPRPS